MRQDIRLVVFHSNEDDPKKCSSRKLDKFGFIRLEKNIKKIPKNMILLNPFAKKSLSREDLTWARRNGILAVDCSWKNAEKSFDFLDKKNVSRALPFVVAGNGCYPGYRNRFR